MIDSWLPLETNTHQDHVIAHLLGTTVLGYFVFDEALYLLLDIGFIWTIFLDGEMALLPHPVAIGELEVDEHARGELRSDIDRLLQGNSENENLLRITPAPLHTDSSPYELCEVNLFQREDGRRLLLICENARLVVETSLTTTDIRVYEQRES